MTQFKLMNLDKLSYKGLNADTGIVVESMPNITTLRVENCPLIDRCKDDRDIIDRRKVMSYSAISVSQTVISSGTVRKCWKSCNSVSGDWMKTVIR